MNSFERELLNDPKKLSFMSNLLRQHQFSEEFLIETIGYYDSWKCLNTIDYNQIKNYLLKRNYTIEEIEYHHRVSSLS